MKVQHNFLLRERSPLPGNVHYGHIQRICKGALFRSTNLPLAPPDGMQQEINDYGEANT